MLEAICYTHIKRIALQAAWILAFSHALLASAENGLENQSKITVYVTVDWEGAWLENDNIEAMQNFRKKFPHIPMLQLLNPAYLLKQDVNKELALAQIKSTFLPSDTQGLHVHAWKSLVEHCQVPYQHSHSFSGEQETCETGDCGYTVSLEYAYSEADLTKLLACSRDLLVQQGFAKAKHFRAGGWQMGPKLANALQANGFEWDSSRIDANLLTTRWHENSGMIKMTSALHTGSTPLEQPFELKAADNQHTALIEYPNNAALADYTSTKQIVEMFKQLILNNKGIMVLGFHQETADMYLPHLEKAIPQMEALAKEANVQLIWASR